MAHVQALESGAQGFANAVKRFAVKDKAFAQELAFVHKIRSEITPNTLKPILKHDTFDKNGKLTEKARGRVLSLIQKLGLPKTATWDDCFAAMRNKPKEMPSLNIELKMMQDAPKDKKLPFELKPLKPLKP